MIHYSAMPETYDELLRALAEIVDKQGPHQAGIQIARWLPGTRYWPVKREE